MAPGGQGNQIRFCIVTTLTSRADMMNLKVDKTGAVLAPSPISITDLVPSFQIPTWAELQPRSPRLGSNHEAVRIFSGTATF
jgi:hypothetical protein